MAYNPIQFQQGMSLPDFFQAFGIESACCEAVLRARWPGGFICPRCGGAAHCILFSLGRPLFQCQACHRQTSLTADTLFASTKLPLTKWCLAIYLISQAKTGLSALQLKRDIGVSSPTAWLMHHKIMSAMTAREAQHQLSGAVRVDDAYLGGERTGGKPGRGSENKIPFVAAVSLNDEGHPRFAKFTPVPRFTNQVISTWAQANLARGTSVLSDGLACFAAVTDAGCIHTQESWANASPGTCRSSSASTLSLATSSNLKTMLSGAYKAFGYTKYADHYLGTFAYRFNRRFDLADLAVRLVVDVCRHPATSERVIRQA